MNIVIGLAEASWVEIGITAIAFLIPALGVFLRYKAKSDKADIMGEVEVKIADEIKPIEKRMDKHDIDFKEFKRDEIEPMKNDIHELITRQSVIDTKVDNVLTGISEIKDYLKDRDKSYKENFLLLFEKLDKKQDKK